MADARNRIADIHVLQGDPVIEILDTTKSLNADMLVMGTHAKGITEHTFMGDVAHKVLKRTRVPVLLVPAVKKS
jgi:nucleotide-binding universal stress UspA family protein